ncbi:MAG: double-strand break repair protein AddB [Alphaproteobacteria bacterium]
MNAAAKNIYNIEAGRPFARILAQKLLDETAQNEERLSRYLILLPTRRACRTLREAFLDLREQKPTLLPRMQPVGDLDEEELSLTLMGQTNTDEHWAIPPALSPLRREIMLARLVRKMHPDTSQEQSLKLAAALGRLMDQIYTENLDMADLTRLAPEDFAAHWQITLEFLEILSLHWPKILDENGVIDQADRRNRLILSLAGLWGKMPPAHPVIAAGTTGSIPSTARLLSVIATLPEGRIILPGLDSRIDEQSWEALNESHPQFGFKQLLNHLNTDRKDVRPFENAAQKNITQEETAQNKNRRFLAREIMRPAQTARQWADLSSDQETRETLKNALENLTLIACEHTREEAETIAVLMRQTLTNPNQTACLITPDRNLAARVAASCARWNITVDDSAGQSLKQTPRGIFIRLALSAAVENMAPLALLSLLKHDLCQIGADRQTHARALRALDYALRGPKPGPGFKGLHRHIEQQDKLDDAIKTAALNMLHKLEKIFKPLQTLKEEAPTFAQILKTHLQICETLAATHEKPGSESLWSGEEGRKSANVFSALLDDTQTLETVDLKDYAAALDHFMDQTQIRPAFGAHPRLQILGTLEARLIDADLVILGGLNEGVWPPEPTADPWMSRPMRKTFGLPSPERGIGLAAHDFVQGFCAPKVVLTRALKSGDAASVPARWLQRLAAVLHAANLECPLGSDILHWVRNLDKAPPPVPALRPAPCPPRESRPRRLSATQIETWLRDPYAIYARHILQLKPLEPLEKPLDAAQRGQLLHTVLERFMLETKTALPPPERSESLLIKIAREEIENRPEEPHVWSFWWPRFAKTARFIATHEKNWRKAAQNLATESKGEIEIKTPGGPFTLVAIADRIDRFNDGKTAIIDYKSGGSFSKKAMQTGALPQLPLEAFILARGGFPALGKHESKSLQYWVLSGAGGGSITALEDDIDTLLVQTGESLTQLIETYDDPAMPYLSLPRPDQAPRFNDYEHLARVREWGLAADDEEAEAA